MTFLCNGAALIFLLILPIPKEARRPTSWSAAEPLDVENSFTGLGKQHEVKEKFKHGVLKSIDLSDKGVQPTKENNTLLDLVDLNSVWDVGGTGGKADIRSFELLSGKTFPWLDAFDVKEPEVLMLRSEQPLPRFSATIIGPCEVPSLVDIGAGRYIMRFILENASARSKRQFNCPFVKLRLPGSISGQRVNGYAAYVPLTALISIWGLLEGPYPSNTTCLFRERSEKNWTVKILDLAQVVSMADTSQNAAESINVASQLLWSSPIVGVGKGILLTNDSVALSWRAGSSSRVQTVLLSNLTAEIRTWSDGSQGLLVALWEVLKELAAMKLDELRVRSKIIVQEFRAQWTDMLEEHPALVPLPVQRFVFLPLMFIIPGLIYMCGIGVARLSAVERQALIGAPVQENPRVLATQNLQGHDPKVCTREVSATDSVCVCCFFFSPCSALQFLYTCCFGCCGRYPRIQRRNAGQHAGDSSHIQAATPWAFAAIDIYSSRVRQPLLPAVILVGNTSILRRMIELAQSHVQEGTNNYVVLYMVIVGLTFWWSLAMGGILLGNSIYHRRQWLLLHLSSVLLSVGECTQAALRPMPPSRLVELSVRSVCTWYALFLVKFAIKSKETFDDQVSYQSQRYVRERLRSTSSKGGDAETSEERTKATGEEAAREKAVEEEASKKTAEGEERKTAAEEEEAREKAAEKDLRTVADEAALKKVVEEMAAPEKLAREEAAEEEARKKDPARAVDLVPPVYYPPLLVMGAILAIEVVLQLAVSGVVETVRYRTVILKILGKVIKGVEIHSAIASDPLAMMELAIAQAPFPLPAFFVDRVTSLVVSSATAIDGSIDSSAVVQSILPSLQGVSRTVDFVSVVMIASVLLGLILVPYSLRRTFSNFRREYIDAVQGRVCLSQFGSTIGPWMSTFFPGVVFSVAVLLFFCMCLAGTIVCLICAFAILSWHSGFPVAWMIFKFAAPFVLIVAGKSLIVERFLFKRELCDEAGNVVRPFPYTVALAAFSVINVLNAWLLALSRVFSIWLLGSRAFVFSASRSGFPGQQLEEKIEDPVYRAFIATVRLAASEYNPTFRVAARALCPAIDATWINDIDSTSSPPPTVPHGKVCALRHGTRQQRLQIRNQFWVALTLYRNPKLKQFRKKALKSGQAEEYAALAQILEAASQLPQGLADSLEAATRLLGESLDEEDNESISQHKTEG